MFEKLHVPKSAEEANRIKYQKKMMDLADKIITIFKEEELNLMDVQNILKIVPAKIDQESRGLNINEIFKK